MTYSLCPDCGSVLDQNGECPNCVIVAVPAEKIDDLFPERDYYPFPKELTNRLKKRGVMKE